MALAKRLSYSLLISTLAFAGFAAVAFTGLFPWIEAQFYSPKVVSEYQARLDKAAVFADHWKSASLEKLDKLAAQGVFDGVFAPTASRETLQKRFQAAKLFVLAVRGGSSLRVLSASRADLHFSTEDGDAKVRGDFSLTYRPVAELADLAGLAAAAPADGKVHLVPTAKGSSLTFVRPWTDPVTKIAGYLVWTLATEDLRLTLEEAGLSLAAQALTPLGDDGYLFSLLGARLDTSLVTRVQELRGLGRLPAVQKLARTEGSFTVALIAQNKQALVVPASALELDPVLKGLLLVSFFTVLFLITFLVANLRGEPLSVVTRRVKRFQLQVVKQYLDLKEQDRIQSLRDELASHSHEIRQDVRKSLGRVRKRDQDWVDRYIDTSWQEVMDLLRGPAPPTESSSNADWKRLETLLQQALTQGRFVVSPAPGAHRPVEGELEEVEEADEVEDLDAVAELEDVADAEVADAEAVEELEDAEAVDDGEVLESLEAADDEDGTPVEELKAEAGTRKPAARAWKTKPADTGELLEELPLAEDQAEGGDELEALDEGDEAVEELPTVKPGQDESFSLEKLDSLWASSPEAVIDESGEAPVLRDEVFADVPEAEGEFGELVGDVLAGPDRPAFETMEEDLVPRVVVREWKWTGGGFDWDRFAQGTDEVSLFRGLSEIVAELGSFTAAILTQTDGVWRSPSSVGFSDQGKTSLNYGPDHPLTKGFLDIRALHVLRGGERHPVMGKSFHTKDLRFLKAIVCVPILFRRDAAWLLLGLRQEPQDVVAMVAPRRVG